MAITLDGSDHSTFNEAVRIGHATAKVDVSSHGAGCGIGLNREVMTGNIFDNTQRAFQLHTNNGDFAIESYNANGSGAGVPFKIDSAGRVTMPYQPKFIARLSGNHSAGNVVYNVGVVNDGGYYSTTTGRFTAPVNGLYFFEAKGLEEGHNSTGTQLALRVNDVLYTYGAPGRIGDTAGNGSYGWGGYVSVAVSGCIYLQAGDYVTVNYGSGGGQLHSNTYWNNFSGFLVG